MKISVVSTIFLASVFCAACGTGDNGADGVQAVGARTVSVETGTPALQRNLTTQEVMDDFNELVGQFRALYGPRKYKERRFGFDFDAWVRVNQAELENAKSDAEAFGVFKKFLAKFQDGHVGITFSSNASEVYRYTLPLLVAPIEGRAIVVAANADMAALGVFVGDELLAVDGVPTMELLPKILKYEAWGNDVTNQHLIAYATRRPFYMTDLTPTRPEASLTTQRPNGDTQTVTSLWRVEKYDMGHPEFAGGGAGAGHAKSAGASADFERARFDGSQAFFFEGAREYNSMLAGTDENASLLQMGAAKPYFVTPQVAAVYGMTQVTPNADSLARFGWNASDVDPGLYAALYQFNGKNLLLLRIPSYAPATPVLSNLKWMKAVLWQYERFVDGLVIDQNHNPGGSLGYVSAVAQIFMQKRGSNLIQAFHADRRWVQMFRMFAQWLDPSGTSETSLLYWLRSDRVREAMDAGKDLTEPYALLGNEWLDPDTQFTWKKPLLVLADELAGSCGDIFPMYMKRNGVARIFGERTMGLGGNVEPITGTYGLGNSLAQARLTRGMFTTVQSEGIYTDEQWVENNGITPDFRYTHTVADFRRGYVGYVAAFSSAL